MALKEGRILLNEEESKDFLMTYGIPVTIAQIVQDPEDAISIAQGGLPSRCQSRLA